MNSFNQTNIKNNIIYFPSWRVKYLKYKPWEWEERYDILTTNEPNTLWTHNCVLLGAIVLKSKYNYCPTCGASKLNEPNEEAIYDYMELNYD